MQRSNDLPPGSWALRRPSRGLRHGLQTGLVFPLHSRVCRPFHVEGAEHLRSLAGPALFVANHTSHLDTPTALRALPPRIRRRVAVAAAADYFYRDRRLGFAASLLLNTFPFCREGPIRGSLERCGELVGAGWSILIFPEGTRSTTGELQPFKGGVGLLARELGVPVVPLAIDGLDRVLPKGSGHPRPGPVTVRIGPPIAVSRAWDRRTAAALLEASVAGLLRPAQAQRRADRAA
jgi:long-chain acyl-CoA synthetase